jgi:hypothetical protein
MRRIFFSTSFLSILIASATFTGCDSTAQKKGIVERSINEASISADGKHDSTLKREIHVSTEVWNTFKYNTDKIIKANKELIEDLRYGKKKTGNRSEMAFEKWIYILEQKNTKLEERISAYSENPGDWESFKNEIYTDFEKLGEELDNLVKKGEEQNI